MMLGETHRPNPTVLVPPWPDPHHDQTDLVYSPVSYNATGNSFNLREALSALQRYLPSNEPDVDLDSEFSGPDSPVDAYSCDHFRMFEFKVRRCARGRSHDWTDCPYAHPGEKARRRDPRKFHYSGTACPDFRKGSCRKGDLCEFAHGVFECWLHPARYRTQPCKDGSGCRRRVCFFAHAPDQLRVVTSGSADSHDGSSPSCAKTLPFWSSPGSVSPPVSPRADPSPPVSPMAQSLSRSLGSASVNEMVASLRNLQLGKVKSLQVGCVSPSGYGSPRGAVIRPGFCSLPSTPTRNLIRSGIGYLDSWDKLWEEEEEPVMERVESGRDLRAKMFEKLSKENSLERANPGQFSGAPDLDWVSDLVN
ncbi:hypothetical protein GQ457_10G000910 [Hibiscus cannabinus]